MDFLTGLILFLLVASVCVLLALEFWWFYRWLTAPGSELGEWLFGANRPPERRTASIDPIVFKTLQGMNQLSQERYLGLRQAQKISDEVLRKVQEITGEQL